MKEIKELDEAINIGAQWLHNWEFEGNEDWENLDSAIQDAFRAQISDLFKNLKGDGWELQIVSTKEAIYHKGYFPKVIWGAE